MAEAGFPAASQVTLGHGFQEPVAQHPFYGTSAVVEDLAAFPGWDQGYVSMRRV